MKGRDKLFFNLLTFLLLVVIGLVGYRTREADKQIRRWETDIRRRMERGVEDPQLRETVDKLEAELRARIEETFVVDEDPLDLVRVIHSPKFFRGKELAETETRMRLSATVTGAEGPTAVIKYKGRSWVLSVGDQVGEKEGVPNSGYRVAAIGVNKITLVRGEEVLVLETEPAPDTIAELETIFGPRGERKPIVDVKEVSAQNF